MDNAEAHEMIAEAKLRSDTMEATVELLNLFGQYLSAESGSSLESDLENVLDQVIQEHLKAGDKGLAGHVILALCALVCESGDHDKIQEFLTEQSDAIQHMVEEAHRGHSH